MWNDLAAKTQRAESDGRSIANTDNVGTNESLRSVWSVGDWKAKFWLQRMWFWSYKAVYVWQNEDRAWVKIIPLKVLTNITGLLLLNKLLFTKTKKNPGSFVSSSNYGSKWFSLVPDNNASVAIYYWIRPKTYRRMKASARIQRRDSNRIIMFVLWKKSKESRSSRPEAKRDISRFKATHVILVSFLQPCCKLYIAMCVG